LQLDVVRARAGIHALVVVVDGDRERFCPFLTDHVLIEDVIDLFGLRDVPEPNVFVDVLVQLFFDDFVAKLDALVADVNPGPAINFRTCSCDLPQKLHFS
jgi:hypothetical protein